MDLHYTLVACPPMSHRVFALTFLRSACQGVEASGILSDRVMPVWSLSYRLSALRLSVMKVKREESRDYTAICIWEQRMSPSIL